MSDHAFSATEWLKARGLLDKRSIELGGKTFEAKAVVTAVENLKAIECLEGNDYEGFFAVIFGSEAKAKAAVDAIRVPIRRSDQRAFWAALITALSGREPGESPAS